MWRGAGWRRTGRCSGGRGARTAVPRREASRGPRRHQRAGGGDAWTEPRFCYLVRRLSGLLRPKGLSGLLGVVPAAASATARCPEPRAVVVVCASSTSVAPAQAQFVNKALSVLGEHGRGTASVCVNSSQGTSKAARPAKHRPLMAIPAIARHRTFIIGLTMHLCRELNVACVVVPIDLAQFRHKQPHARKP